MAGEREKNDLRSMLRFLCQDEVPKAVFRARCQNPAPANPTRLIEDVFDLDQSSLQGWYSNGMPDDRIDHLAEWYQFTLQIRVVFSKGAHSTGHHGVFKATYLTHWKPKLAVGDLERTAKSTPHRLHDPAVQLKVQRSVRDKPEGSPDEDRPNLASLMLFLRQVGPGDSIPVSVELICQPEPVGGFDVAVYRGRLEIVPGSAPIDQKRPPLASDAAHSNRGLTLERANASSKDGRIAWTVRSDKGPIGVLRLDDDVDLCQIAEPADGDTIAAVFHAYVKDLDLAEPDPDDEPGNRVDPYSFLRPDGITLSPNKRQLIKRLILEDELGPAPKGWHTLAEDRAQLVRNDK